MTRRGAIFKFKFVMHKKILIFLICFFVFNSQAWAALNWLSLESGLQYQVFQRTFAEAAVAIHVLKIVPHQFDIKPIVVKENTSVRSMAQSVEALAVINANFFDTEGKILGLVVDNKNIIQRKKDISWWSIFCVNKNGSKIIHTKNYKDGICDQAVQAGPRLVIDGSVPELKEKTSRKTVVGIDSKGGVYFVVTKQAISIKELAVFMKDSVDNNGLGCLQAINMDGGSSSQMYVEGLDGVFNITGLAGVPVGLGVFRKK